MLLLISGLAILFAPIPLILQESAQCMPCELKLSPSQCPRCPQKGDIEWKPSLALIIWGRLTRTYQEGEMERSPTTGKKDCNYNGVDYKDGEGFGADDGCNVCSCDDGFVKCTLIAC